MTTLDIILLSTLSGFIGSELRTYVVRWEKKRSAKASRISATVIRFPKLRVVSGDEPPRAA
jgi:hypothetical protein